MRARIDVEDIQSLVFSGHGRLPAAVALGLVVRDTALARAALRALVDADVSFGFGEGSRERAVQLLLTAGGIAALGGSAEDLAGFSRQFQQGMVTPQRSRALADAERSNPGEWTWSDGGLDALAIVYASEPSLARAAADMIAGGLASGFSVERTFAIELPPDGREPFGFRDGISGTRVDVDGSTAKEPGIALLPPGEIVLGCENAAGVVVPAPRLGENGAFVVIRQLEQDVEGFWKFWREQARDDVEAVWHAAKALGRWPNGMPVDGTSPQPEPAFVEAQALAPLQFSADPRGLKCPFGAHVRRANPRDGLGEDPAASLEIVRHHRMIRRGRVYGSPAPAAWYPETLRVMKRPLGGPASDAATERGLFFMCLCADIARQFEFVQQTWLNNPKFSDLYDEVDPIAAGHGIPADSHRYAIPRLPLRQRVNGVTRWVRVRGGGYFLLPGRRALQRFLA